MKALVLDHAGAAAMLAQHNRQKAEVVPKIRFSVQPRFFDIEPLCDVCVTTEEDGTQVVLYGVPEDRAYEIVNSANKALGQGKAVVIGEILEGRCLITWQTPNAHTEIYNFD
jgi:hypothetical protein